MNEARLPATIAVLLFALTVPSALFQLIVLVAVAGGVYIGHDHTGAA